MTFIDIRTPDVQTDVQILPGRLISWDNIKFRRAVSFPDGPGWPTPLSLDPVFPAYELARKHLRLMIAPFALDGQLPHILKRVGQDEQAVSEDALPRISGAHVRIYAGAADWEKSAVEAAVNATDRGVVFYNCLGQILPTQFTMDCVVINNAAHSLDDMEDRVVVNRVECSAFCNIAAWQQRNGSTTRVTQTEQPSLLQVTPTPSPAAEQLGELTP